jgi:hypothetical protein
MAPWVTAAKIIEYSQTKSNEQFYNFVLGEPFIGQGNTVTEDLFWRNLTEKLNAQKRPIIGCDSGIKKHFVVGNEEGLFWYGVTEDWEDVARMLMRCRARCRCDARHYRPEGSPRAISRASLPQPLCQGPEDHAAHSLGRRG